MKRFLVLIITFILGVANAQVYPFQDMFFWSTKDIVKNNIKQIDGYELAYSPNFRLIDSNIVKGEHQTEEIFDSLGRIRSKTNFYLYSDIESKKRTLKYDLQNQVIYYANFEKDSLKREELYTWSDGQLENWKVKAVENGETINFSKETMCNSRGKEVREILKIGRKILRMDTIMYIETDTYKAKIRRDKYKNVQIDSIVTYKVKGDTLYKQEIYEANVLTYKEVHWQDDESLTQRIEEYQDGLFHKVYYRVSKEGRVFFEKQIHVVPNLNFDKLYYYSDTGVPIKKEIYRNEDTPEYVVYYIVQKR